MLFGITYTLPPPRCGPALSGDLVLCTIRARANLYLHRNAARQLDYFQTPGDLYLARVEWGQGEQIRISH